jgi:hypothetical protein
MDGSPPKHPLGEEKSRSPLGQLRIYAQGACPRIENLLRQSPVGQMSRSCSLNRHYLPQMIKKSDSKWCALATMPILGQAPRGYERDFS